MSNIELYQHGLIAVYDKPLRKIMPALKLGTRGWQNSYSTCHHDPRYLNTAREGRDEFLPFFAQAEADVDILRKALRQRPDRKIKIAMVATLLGALGAKDDKAMIFGMADALEDCEIKNRLDRNRPFELSQPGLALACRELIKTSVYTPRPVELLAACENSENHLRFAIYGLNQLTEFIRKCDAIVLEFAYSEWEKSYLTPELRPIVARMLFLHDIYGDGTNEWDEGDYYDDDDENPVRPFSQILEMAKQKFKAELKAYAEEPEEPDEPESTPMRNVVPLK
jgi:hypothetical protein